VWEGESGLRCGKTVWCVYGAYSLARGSPVVRDKPAIVDMIHDVASHTFCVSQPAAP
jgi:hypothetical protein